LLSINFKDKEIKMQIAIKPDQEKFILEKLQQGKYKSVDDLLTVAFQLLDQHDEREKQLIELRQKIAEGTQQIREGKVVDGELVFQQLQEKLNSMEER
jgi:antitoxin ParD1/3/4